MDETRENIIYQTRQGMGQFVMTMFYKLGQHEDIQVAAQDTLNVINDTRNMFIEKTSLSFDGIAIEALNERIKGLEQKYPEADEQTKRDILITIEKYELLRDDIEIAQAEAQVRKV